VNRTIHSINGRVVKFYLELNIYSQNGQENQWGGAPVPLNKEWGRRGCLKRINT